ncbi:hypothetical protein LA345_12885 [Burkholderia vietnamiensis]|uniref:Uncharacterized protein n=1 Tax=Burkholderia vietnamiensis (strain G4 / LMG 22486) TaxID=269482 RepID=A4JFJ4_BURVG|nr:hypothetical protein Bcep1808_2045 [Burkholderia vietnamiensis G4]MCB4344807.1 hypothetical protein [Burkholderia vietnamiensis]
MQPTPHLHRIEAALAEAEPIDPMDDSFLLPAGDASEFDDLDEEVRVEDLDRAKRSRIEKIEAIARMDEMVRALRGVRLVGVLARIDRHAKRAIVRVELDPAPSVPARWLIELPDCVALDLHEGAYTEPHLKWLLSAEGERVAFSLRSDADGTPKATAVKSVGESSQVCGGARPSH